MCWKTLGLCLGLALLTGCASHAPVKSVETLDETPGLTRAALVQPMAFVETGISDSGPGVAAEVADALFRPFVTTKPRGTGLGLASSRAIIESHEGTIGYDSLPQGGSRFWFRLPVAQS